MNLLAVDVPSLPDVTIWGAGPGGINKTGAIYVFAAARSSRPSSSLRAARCAAGTAS